MKTEEIEYVYIYIYIGTGMMDGKRSRGRPLEEMTEGMAQWLHKVDMTDMPRASRVVGVERHNCQCCKAWHVMMLNAFESKNQIYIISVML